MKFPILSIGATEEMGIAYRLRQRVLLGLGLILITYAYAAVSLAQTPVECGGLSPSMLSVIGEQLPEAAVFSCDGPAAKTSWSGNDKEVLLRLDVDRLPVMEAHEFYGLASYYNNVRVIVIDKDGVLSEIEDGNQQILGHDQRIAFVGRFSVLLVQAPGTRLGRVTGDNHSLVSVTWPAGSAGELDMIQTDKDRLPEIDPVLSALRYSHLWGWLAGLSKAVEWSLTTIQQGLGVGWGWAIVSFAVLLKIVLLPVSLVTLHFQRQVSQYQAILGPQLADIKSKYDGEAAHEKIMAAHKALGITPFYSLKPMLGAFVQVPILVAVFNALGEMPQLSGSGFMWIEDLAYPDVIGSFSVAIPMFGDKLSLLPILMTLVTIFSTLIFQNRHAPEAEVRRQKRNLYFMAAAFFILFYPFPAAMVLYWTLANILQTVQQQLIRI